MPRFGDGGSAPPYEPRSIEVTPVADGLYMVREEDGTALEIPSPTGFIGLHDWTLNLGDTELEAAIQIWYDKWNFQSGQECDKVALEALEQERKRRKLRHSTFAPGIF